MSEKEFTEDEIIQIVRSISQPVFNYAIKRFVKQVKEQTGMSLNTMITVFLGSMATCDANLLRWVKSFGMAETGKDVQLEKLKEFFNKELNVQLVQKLH